VCYLEYYHLLLILFIDLYYNINLKKYTQTKS